MNFNKAPYSIQALLKLLESRGMLIDNYNSAEIALKSIGYYRFSGFALHFEQFKERERMHKFKQNSKFDDVISLYEFDDKLRTLLFDYIGHIEIAFRVSLCNEIANETNNSHWYTEENLFKDETIYKSFVKNCNLEIKRSKENFIVSYKNKYNYPELPPVWMMLEILSMGTWSKVFSNIKCKNLQKKVSSNFNIQPHYLQSWIHSLSVLRNFCAHHYRIWNRNFTIKLHLTKKQKKIISNNAKLSAFLLIINDMLSSIGRAEDFKMRMKNLLNEYPNIPIHKMGLSKDVIEKLGY